MIRVQKSKLIKIVRDDDDDDDDHDTLAFQYSRLWVNNSAVVGNILAKLRKWKFHSRHNFWQGKRILTPFLTKMKKENSIY